MAACTGVTDHTADNGSLCGGHTYYHHKNMIIWFNIAVQVVYVNRGKGATILLFFPLLSLLSYFFVWWHDLTAHPILTMTIRGNAMGFTTPIQFDYFYEQKFGNSSPQQDQSILWFQRCCNASYTFVPTRNHLRKRKTPVPNVSKWRSFFPDNNLWEIFLICYIKFVWLIL